MQLNPYSERLLGFYCHRTTYLVKNINLICYGRTKYYYHLQSSSIQYTTLYRD